MLWIYALAHGYGITAWILSNKVFTTLSPYTYHLYLLHVPISKYVWLALRGTTFNFWWPIVPAYPVPLKWWEFFLTVTICLILGWFIEKYLVPKLQPYTMQWGVSICGQISNFFSKFASRVNKETIPSVSQTLIGHSLSPSMNSETNSLLNSSVHNSKVDTKKEEVLTRLEGIVGVKISTSTPFRDLGLDSLGGTALLNALKSAIPGTKHLTMDHLTEEYETVGDLVNFVCNNSDDLDRGDVLALKTSKVIGVENTCSQSQRTGMEHVDVNTRIILQKIEGVTGVPADLSTLLNDLGLDSLGGTALLGALKSTIPEAKDLSIDQLVNDCENVGDLIHLLSIQGV